MHEHIGQGGEDTQNHRENSIHAGGVVKDHGALGTQEEIVLCKVGKY